MIFYLAFFFILGLVLGSFANVCIYRIPKEESIIKPRSYCPVCNNTILWYDNIPTISYIMLKRRCRSCGSLISWRYPTFECVTGVSFLLVAWRHAHEPALPVLLVFTFLLIVISGIDFFHQIIPDTLSILILVFGIGFSFFNPELGLGWKMRFLNALLGGIIGGGFLFLAGIAGKKIFRKDAMGAGDVKLMLAIGTMFGWQKSLVTIFIASCLGSIYGIALISTNRIGRKDYIPFGPFLAFSSYLTLFINKLWIW